MKSGIIFHIVYLVAVSFCSCQSGESENILWTSAWSPDGKQIAVGGDIGKLMIFDVTTFQLSNSFPFTNVIISRVKWHPTKNKLAVVTQSNTIKTVIINFDNGEVVQLKGLESSLRGLDWSKKGKYLAVSDLEGGVWVFDEKGNNLSHFEADEKAVTGLDWHPQKDVLVTVGSSIGIFTIEGEQLLQYEPRDEEVFLLCVEWHPSGQFFAVGDYGDIEHAKEKLLQFWNPDGEIIFTAPSSHAEYRNIRWDPSGEFLATANNALRIWSKEGELLHESESSEDYLWGVDWSPDGEFIVTTSRKGKITIWDTSAKVEHQVQYPR